MLFQYFCKIAMSPVFDAFLYETEEMQLNKMMIKLSKW